MTTLLVFLSLAVLGAPQAPDTLVVCPAAFRPALAEWESYRREQGHVISIVEPPQSAEQLRAVIRHASESGRLKYVVLVGDVPSAAPRGLQRSRLTIPTNYVAARINIRWGSEPTIASDTPYADIDGDNLPDLAIGRIPADSAAELATVVRKTLRYEQAAEHGSWERRLSFTSGCGGFGAVTDAIIEAAARQVILQLVPPEYETRHLCATTVVGKGAVAASFGAQARQQLSEGSLAWIYMGHGRPTELDRDPTMVSNAAILSVSDVPQLRCGGHSPLAVLIACYTGAMDAPRDCLAEELLLADEGPVAVIAATRVSMPYGNTVLGCELMRACFQDRPERLGDTLRLAQRRTSAAPPNDQLRTSLDSMAAGLSPSPVDLVGERREHVLMYHLIGDPLLRLRRPEVSLTRATGERTITK